MSFLFSIFTLIASYQVIWTHTFIDVKLGDQIEDYTKIPSAQLYIDGKLIDTNATYQYNGVNRTFISTVQTSYVKAYEIDYEVYFSEYDISHIATITFNVCDQIPPTFLYMPHFQMDIFENIPDLSENVIYSDNYDDVIDLKLIINDNEINNQKAGRYFIYYELMDTSFNITKLSTYIDVIDHEAPTIEIKKDIIISYGQTFISIDDFLEIKDNSNEYLSVIIVDDEVDYSKIGTYMITVIAIDSSKLKTIENIKVEIIDDEAPVLMLSAPYEIDVYDDDIFNHLSNYILSISDNYDQLTIDDVSIISDIDITTLGSYHIYFKVLDQSNNICEKTLTVKVVDNKSPSIELIAPLIFEVFSPKPFFFMYFNIFDNYDQFGELTLSFDDDVNMNKIGLYQIIVEVKDSSKNIGLYYDYIEIVDTKAPEIEQLNDIIITTFEAISYESYFSYFDNYDLKEDIIIIFDDSQINYSQIGTYSLKIIAFDLSNNEKMNIVDVFVVDIEPPVLQLNTLYVYIGLFHEIIDFTQYITKISDNYDALLLSDVEINHALNYDKIGKYEVRYDINDHSLNHTIIILNVYVDDLVKPMVEMSDLVIYQNDLINYYEDIHIVDDSSYKIIVDENYIDTSLLGTQYVTYVILDERGNYTKYIRKVTIINLDESIDYIAYLPVLIVVLIGFSSGFYIYKKH